MNNPKTEMWRARICLAAILLAPIVGSLLSSRFDRTGSFGRAETLARQVAKSAIPGVQGIVSVRSVDRDFATAIERDEFHFCVTVDALSIFGGPMRTNLLIWVFATENLTYAAAPLPSTPEAWEFSRK